MYITIHLIILNSKIYYVICCNFYLKENILLSPWPDTTAIQPFISFLMSFTIHKMLINTWHPLVCATVQTDKIVQ